MYLFAMRGMLRGLEAPVAELVDAADSKSAVLGRGSSSLPGGTRCERISKA